MLLAMISVLTLLPKLILIIKPFGKKIKALYMMIDLFEEFISSINFFDIFFLSYLYLLLINVF